jgi:flagellar basal-body rod protein FlgB
MIENKGFDRTLGILEKTMSANIQRRELIANNLANANTPNFKRSNLNFEAELKRALEYEKSAHVHLQARQTHEKHYAFATPKNWQEVQASRHLDYLSTVHANGNNVDLEQEIVERAKADRMYELLSTVTKFQFNQVSIVVR